jgi:Fascin domain
LQGKTSEVIENTPNAPLIKARGILIKDRSGNSLCADKCGEVENYAGSLSAGSESWSELWLAEKIQGTTKYTFRSFSGKYLTAQKDSLIVTADKNIALACEVWTVERLNDGSMAFKSQHGRYLGIDRNTGIVDATQIAHDEHSQWQIEELDSFNDFVL